jgi:hypothetical protein
MALFGTIGAFGMAHVVHMGLNELIRDKKVIGSHLKLQFKVDFFWTF